MRRLAIVWLCAALIPGVQAADAPRLPAPKEYADHALRKSGFVRAGAGTAIAQIANTPREWGRTAAGAAKRFGSAFGKHLVKSSVQLTVATLRHEDLRYHRSEESGFRPRMKHALISTVVARKTTSGKPAMATGRVAGSFASGFVSELWLPVRLHTVSNGLASGGISLGVDALTNVAREFWPEIRHPRKRQ
jgi:hypothetical protein